MKVKIFVLPLASANGLGDSLIFRVLTMPEFPGGEGALQKYFEQNVHYPYSAIKDKIEGKVLVTFVIDATGNVRNIWVARSLDNRLDKVAEYVVSNLPRWKPGRQREKPLLMSFFTNLNQ